MSGKGERGGKRRERGEEDKENHKFLWDGIGSLIHNSHK